MIAWFVLGRFFAHSRFEWIEGSHSVSQSATAIVPVTDGVESHQLLPAPAPMAAEGNEREIGGRGGGDGCGLSPLAASSRWSEPSIV